MYHYYYYYDYHCYFIRIASSSTRRSQGDDVDLLDTFIIVYSAAHQPGPLLKVDGSDDLSMG